MSYVKGIAQSFIVVAGATATTVGAAIATDKIVSDRKFSPEFRDALEIAAPYVGSGLGYIASDLLASKALKTTSFFTRNIKALKMIYNA